MSSAGFSSRINNKVRVIQRRAYGLAEDEEYLRLKILTCVEIQNSSRVHVMQRRWIFRGMAPVSDGIRERPPMVFYPQGLMHPRRTVDLVIPCRVASPQSPIPFHQVALD